MILIITTNNDQVTTRICMWMLHLKLEFKLISDSDIIEPITINKEICLIRNVSRGYKIDINSVDVVFYRQGDIVLENRIPQLDDKNESNFLFGENSILQELLYYRLKKMNSIGHPQLADLNKLIVLEQANDFQLSVPEYIFTSEKSELLLFLQKHPDVITKTILPMYIYKKEQSNYLCYTELLSLDDVMNLKNRFYPTFFQKLIQKKFDVRVFFLENNCYSVAIISQNNSQTRIDFRVYDKEMPNRQIPFEIPNELKLKLQKLISNLKLKYCSVDLIYGEDKKFYFLEINPIGQFGNVSYHGNYFLEKKIAENIYNEKRKN